MTKHKELIQELIKTIPGTATHGFRKKSIDAIKRTMGHFWHRWREQEFSDDLNFIPDAYSIGDREITIYEVIVTHLIKPSKIQALAHAWFALDCWEWNLRLITVNQFGVHSEVDLCSQWHKMWEPTPPPIVEEPPKPDEPQPLMPRGPRSNKVFWWEQC